MQLTVPWLAVNIIIGSCCKYTMSSAAWWTSTAKLGGGAWSNPPNPLAMGLHIRCRNKHWPKTGQPGTKSLHHTIMRRERVITILPRYIYCQLKLTKINITLWSHIISKANSVFFICVSVLYLLQSVLYFPFDLGLCKHSLDTKFHKSWQLCICAYS